MNGSEYLVGATDDASRSAFWLFRSQPGVPSFSAQVAQLLKNSATFEAFSPDGGRLVVSSPIDVIATNHIRERTLAQATGTGIEGAPDLGVSSVTFLDDRVLMTGHSDGSIGFWEIDGGPIFSTNWSPDEALGHDGGQFAMSGNGARLAHTADDRRIVLWGLPNGRRLSEFVATPSGSIDALALSPDGEMIGYIVDTKEEGPYELWLRRADGLLVYRARLPRASSGLEERYDNAQSQLRFSRAGNEMLLAVATEDGTVTVWDLRRPEEPKLIAGPSYEPSPVMIAIHPNHTIFATAAANGHLRLWNRAVATSTLLDTAAPPASRYGAALAFARDGQTLIGIFDLHEEGITLSSWNVSTEPVRRINVPFYFSEEARLNRQSVTQPSFITISGESGLIAAEDDGSVSIWNLDPVALVLEDLHSHVIADFIRFTDDGTRLFVVGYTGVTQVDIGDNALIGNACKIVGARPFRADEEARYLGGVPPVLDCKKYSTLGDSAASRKGPTTGR